MPPAVIGYIVGSVIGAAVALVAALTSYLSSRESRQATENQRIEDRRVRQLNELYGPLYMRRKLSRRLWKQLPDIPNPDPEASQWRLIDHIEEIKGEADNRRRLIVEKILGINGELTDLLVGSAGLFEGFPPPDSFETFLEHAETLRLHWEKGSNAAGVSYIPFPRGMDADIEAAIERIRSQL